MAERATRSGSLPRAAALQPVQQVDAGVNLLNMANSGEVQLQAFLRSYPTRTYRKGEIIIFQGEAPRTAFIVKRGVVKTYNLSASGDEKPVAFYTSLESFPLSWVFGKLPSAIYYHEAFTEEVEVYLVPPHEFVEFIRSHPEAMYDELLKFVTDHVGKSMRLNALQHSRAGDKLVYTLHYLALSHGKKVGPRVIEIGLQLTHQDFANLTGLTRETAATELNKLKRLGIISYGKHTPYRIKLDKLNAMLNDQYIADLEIKL
ncbi:MAG TPA: Crp/Fnr family transcriptional regulator [Candidatus Saccharimonadales bacterium]|nr:Crp/Fnr family transcriptional regulator [Candidatus Saccharimonadales bacterium]